MADVIWNTDSKELKSYFRDYISQTFPDFTFKYNWIEFPYVEDYLIRLFLNSQAENIHLVNDPLLTQKIPTYINYMEDFFMIGIRSGLFNEHTFPRVMESLKDPINGCKKLDFLPEGMRGLFGQSIGHAVQVNPSFKKHILSPDLTPDDLSRLYLYHELGHKILHVSSNEKSIQGFCDTMDNVLESKGLDRVETNYMSYVPEGFDMIEECLTQEMAEMFTYYAIGKKRPQYTRRYDLNSTVKSNLDYYGIFQMPTVQLGKTLRGCDNGMSSSRVILLNMIRKALFTDFADELFAEYNDGDGELYYDLFKTLRCMGILKHQKYASFGIGIQANVNTNDLLKTIETITYRNADCRPYPSEGFPKMDFEKFRTSQGTTGSRH